ncbi:MAG: N-acetyltransferase, partial [Legionella sp.]|nr:N-acetyltransferase [Legionella sp.]
MSAGSPIVVRPERAGDEAAIRRLLDEAFAGPEEGQLVERLRAHGDLVLALVALDGENIVGYAAWPRLWIETPRDEYKAVALAPLAVAPSRQRDGIGSELTREGLAQLRSLGESIVFVLGDPVYYRRFGFTAEAASGYGSTYTGAHFMGLTLNVSAPPHGRVRYPAA